MRLGKNFCTGAYLELFMHSKGWFPHNHPDHPNHPSRLKIGSVDLNDYMATLQKS